MDIRYIVKGTMQKTIQSFNLYYYIAELWGSSTENPKVFA